MKLILIQIFLFVVSVFGDEDCKTPLELKLKEEYCWTEEVEVVDRIVQRSKNVLNFAKKKLGIIIEEENSNQKCEYYVCILRQLNLLNANDYPAFENIKEWIKKYVIYFQAIGLMEQLDKCNEALTNSTMQEKNFYADLVDNHNSNGTDKYEIREQTTCEIAAQFIDCLSRQKQCPVFHYP
ncbi:uncharacterized protein [Tenebrio molitor]|uniref:uncharacterized protein n=1 Tax=Tenebrio molitor TaxID=7067 RepID=UPI001C3B8894|nr:unnamed protein product [Tenebrio molitor]